MTKYVDKEILHNEIVKYQAERKHAIENGLPEPVPSDYIGKAVIDIATGVSQMHNFRSYSWLDDMIGDAVIQSCKAIKKYNPSVSNNPYGFLTRTVVWAFQARLNKEKKILTRKNEMMADNTLDFYSRAPDGEEYMLPRDVVVAMFNAD